MAAMIVKAEEFVCYLSPGVQNDVAMAITTAITTIGSESVVVCVDFDESVMRMCYGTIEAIRMLQDNGEAVTNSPGLRTSLLIVDGEGYSITPTPLYLEAEKSGSSVNNALNLTLDQATEALARISPVSKSLATSRFRNMDHARQIEEAPIEVNAKEISEDQIRNLHENLQATPPVSFDLARPVRVFESYIQYVELSLTGAAIQRHRLTIPKSIQNFGNAAKLEGRIRTTFELLDKNDDRSSMTLERELTKIRNNLTCSLGMQHGRVLLKSAKPLFQK